MTKIMYLTGHNSYLGCRFCYLKGVYCNISRHVYFPCNMPRGHNNTDYNSAILNERTESSFQQDILLVENSEHERERKDYIKQTGKLFNNILL